MYKRQVWNLADAPIPPLWEGDILPLKEAEVTVNPGETRAHTVLFDKIYAAYLLLDVSGACEIEAHIFELEGQSGDTLKARFAGAERFRSLSMYSTGCLLYTSYHYFPDDDPTKEPNVRWRAHSNLLFQNWLNYCVYQETPYDLDEIGKK